MSTHRRRPLRWLGLIVLVLVLLPITVGGLLYVPYIQGLAVEWLASRLTLHTGIKVSVGTLRVRPPLRIVASDINVGPSLHIESIKGHLLLRTLMQGTISASHIDIRGVDLHSVDQDKPTDVTLAHAEVTGIAYSHADRKLRVSSIALTEPDISLTKPHSPTTKDGQTSWLPFALEIDELRLLRSAAHYTAPQMALESRAETLTLRTIATDTLQRVALGDIALGGATIALTREGSPRWEATHMAAQATDIHYAPHDVKGQGVRLTLIGSHGVELQAEASTCTWDEGQLSIPSYTLRTQHSVLSGHLLLSPRDIANRLIDCEATLSMGYPDAALLMRSIKSLPTELAHLYPTETLSVHAALRGTAEHLQLSACRVSMPSTLDIALEGTLRHIGHPRQQELQLRWSASTDRLDGLDQLIATKDIDIAIPHPIAYEGMLHYTPDTMYTQCLFALDKGTAYAEASYRPDSQTYALSVKTDSLDLRQILPHGDASTATLQVELRGHGLDWSDEHFTLHSKLHLDALRWREHSFTEADAEISIAHNQLAARAECHDSLMKWTVAATVEHSDEELHADLYAHIAELHLQPLRLTGKPLSPTLKCHTTLHIDSTQRYQLQGGLTDIALTTSDDTLHLQPITFDALYAHDTALLNLHTGGIVTSGLKSSAIAVTISHTNRKTCARLHSTAITWQTPQVALSGKASATVQWQDKLSQETLSGKLQIESLQGSIPTYGIELHTADTLSIPFDKGALTLASTPLHTNSGQALLLEGQVSHLENTPHLLLRLSAQSANLLSSTPTKKAMLYGDAIIDGEVTLSGPFNSLMLSGELALRDASSLHYTYKKAILTTNNQLGNIATFVGWATDSVTTPPTRSKRTTSSFAMDLAIAIAPTAKLEVAFGTSMQNLIAVQGGGTLTLQYSTRDGMRLIGRYVIETGDLSLNIPLLHTNHMSIRPGSSITWAGKPSNPLLDITAEEHIRASVTLHGETESVLFTTGLSVTDTMDKLNIHFTLSAPENVTMQNTLTTLSAEEKGKLAIALLTTGLYLGEGGKGNLMNTALMSLLQTQLDNISRDAFHTIDVSIAIEPLTDGVSGISTRTNYSFSLAKRLWDDRIRIIIGGRVTANNEQLESDGVIDNISIEWRISPIGNQYLRIFYDKRYESILEGEIREAGVGYVYRRSF